MRIRNLVNVVPYEDDDFALQENECCFSCRKNVNRTESCQMAKPGSTNYPPVWLGVWEWSPSNSRNWWWFARPLKCLWLPSFERQKGVGYWRQVGSWVGSRGYREMWLETHLCNLHSEMEILIEGGVRENRNWVWEAEQKKFNLAFKSCKALLNSSSSVDAKTKWITT